MRGNPNLREGHVGTQRRWLFPEKALDEQTGNAPDYYDLLGGVGEAVYYAAKRTQSDREGEPVEIHLNQLAGGIALILPPGFAPKTGLLNGNVTQLPTGEGKSILAAIPGVFGSMLGRVWFSEPYQHLVFREAEQRGKLYDFLGISVGVLGEQTKEGLFPAYLRTSSEEYAQIVSTVADKNLTVRNKAELAATGIISDKLAKSYALDIMSAAEDILSVLGNSAEEHYRGFREAPLDGNAEFLENARKAVPENPIFSAGKHYSNVSRGSVVITKEGESALDTLGVAYSALFGKLQNFKEGAHYVYLENLRRARLTQEGAEALVGDFGAKSNPFWYELPSISWAVEHELLSSETPHLRLASRKSAYANSASKHITMGTFTQFVFDYLLDGLAKTEAEQVQSREKPELFIADEIHLAVGRELPYRISRKVPANFKSYYELLDAVSDFEAYRRPKQETYANDNFKKARISIENLSAAGIELQKRTSLRETERAINRKFRESGGTEDEGKSIQAKLEYLIGLHKDWIYDPRTGAIEITDAGLGKLEGRTSFSREGNTRSSYVGLLVEDALLAEYAGGSWRDGIRNGRGVTELELTPEEQNALESSVEAFVNGTHYRRQKINGEVQFEILEEGYRALFRRGVLPHPSPDANESSVRSSVENLLRAKFVLKRNINYVMPDDCTEPSEITLVDLEGRRGEKLQFDGGLQEALFVVNGTPLPRDTSETVAETTAEQFLANFRVVGLTATAEELEGYLERICRLGVYIFPSDSEMRAESGGLEIRERVVEDNGVRLKQEFYKDDDTGQTYYVPLPMQGVLITGGEFPDGKAFAKYSEVIGRNLSRDAPEDRLLLAHYLAVATEAIKTKQGNPPLGKTPRPVQIYCGADGTMAEELTRLVRYLGIEETRHLTADNQEEAAPVIAEAAKSVTVATDIFFTGADPPRAEHLVSLGGSLGPGEEGGYHVIQAILPTSISKAAQVRGRAGRQGESASSREVISVADPLLYEVRFDWEREVRRPEQDVLRLAGSAISVVHGAEVSSAFARTQEKYGKLKLEALEDAAEFRRACTLRFESSIDFQKQQLRSIPSRQLLETAEAWYMGALTLAIENETYPNRKIGTHRLAGYLGRNVPVSFVLDSLAERGTIPRAEIGDDALHELGAAYKRQVLPLVREGRVSRADGERVCAEIDSAIRDGRIPDGFAYAQNVVIPALITRDKLKTLKGLEKPILRTALLGHYSEAIRRQSEQGSIRPEHAAELLEKTTARIESGELDASCPAVLEYSRPSFNYYDHGPLVSSILEKKKPKEIRRIVYGIGKGAFELLKDLVEAEPEREGGLRDALRASLEASEKDYLERLREIPLNRYLPKEQRKELVDALQARFRQEVLLGFLPYVQTEIMNAAESKFYQPVGGGANS
ncbi:MAG: hypothetical protein V1820_00705 [archaeon]